MGSRKKKKKTAGQAPETDPRKGGSKNKASAGGRVWGFFASVKLSFVLFIALAAASVLGTLLPQKEAAELYVREFGRAGGELILKLGLNDAYHAPWFLLLLCLLAANLVVCSLERLPKALKIIRKDPAQDLGRKRQPAQSFTLPGGVEGAAAKAQKALEHRLGKVYRRDQGESKTLLAQKGAWSRLGVYVVHLSVLVIFAGAVIGGVWGFGGFVSIDQGASVDHIQLDNGGARPLGFSVRLDKFTLTKYQGKEIPSEYRSDVTFLAGGEEVKKASLIVNDPAEFNGIVFYQSSYGQRPRSMKLRMIRGEQTVELNLVPRRWNNLPGGGRAGVMDFREHVAMGAMYHGPIARVIYQAEGREPMALTAFKPGAKVPARGPVRFEILDVVSTPYTGLQVKYDPGVWLVWVGCTLMVIGFIIAFYLSHRKVWIRVSPTPSGRARVEIAGSTNKNRPGLDRLMMRLAGRIKQGE